MLKFVPRDVLEGIALACLLGYVLTAYAAEKLAV